MSESHETRSRYITADGQVHAATHVLLHPDTDAVLSPLYAAWRELPDCSCEDTESSVIAVSCGCAQPAATWFGDDPMAWTAQPCEECDGDGGDCLPCRGSGEGVPEEIVDLVWRGALDLAEDNGVVQAGCQTHDTRRDGSYFEHDPDVQAGFEEGWDPCVPVVYPRP